MTESIIYSLIKTPCGRAKYHEISSRNNLFSKVRLIWFIAIASIKDLNIPNPDKKINSDL